ncbi:MAG TPA: RNA polymerase sigma factor [Myxococcaceae bacterium]|jgi:RNA polymerase sigma factor (sigma-70 family)
MHENRDAAEQGRNAEGRKYYTRLFNALFSRARSVSSGSEADALDLTQEVLERFVRQFGAVAPPEPVAKAWLKRTLDRMVISNWRKQVVRGRALLDPAFQLAAVSGPADLEREWNQDDLRRAVDALSPRLRETFVLHQGGLSRLEIAAELQIKGSVVSKRLHDARARLRAMIGPRLPRRGAHFAVRRRPGHGGPGPVAAQT